MPAFPSGATILQVTPALDAGGVEQTTLDIAEAVRAAGGRALVASAGGRMAAELEARGGELVSLPIDTKNPLAMAHNIGRLERLIRAERVDLVHVRSRAPAFSAIPAAHRAQVPVVTTYHGVYGARSGPKRWYNRIMTRGDLTIANSAYTRRHVIAEHGVDPSSVVAIPRGVDLRRFDPAAVPANEIAALRAAWGIEPGDARPVLLLAGRLTRWKGQTLAIEALSGLKDEGMDAILVLLGDDQGRVGYALELKTLAEKLGLEDAVRFPGHETNMPAAYLAADIVLAPSIKPEAFGRTAVEPQVMGRPVLAAAHGAATETVIDSQTGWLVEPGSADAWTKALAEAIDAGPDLRAEMGAAARIRAAALYSLEAMAASTLEVYAKLLARRLA
jgi:glycosyltransferase involved in cell wall biosynthesis